MNKPISNSELEALRTELEATKAALDTAIGQHPDLSIAEVCERLSCSRMTTYRLINSGRLSAYKLGRATRIIGSSFAEFRSGVERQYEPGGDNIPCGPRPFGNQAA